MFKKNPNPLLATIRSKNLSMAKMNLDDEKLVNKQ